jgi:hypothetical protein
MSVAHLQVAHYAFPHNSYANEESKDDEDDPRFVRVCVIQLNVDRINEVEFLFLQDNMHILKELHDSALKINLSYQTVK